MSKESKLKAKAELVREKQANLTNTIKQKEPKMLKEFSFR